MWPIQEAVIACSDRAYKCVAWWLGVGSSLGSLDGWIKLICVHVGMLFQALVITNGEYNP